MRAAELPKKSLYCIADYLQKPYRKWQNTIEAARHSGLYLAFALQPTIPLSASRKLSKIGDLTKKFADALDSILN